MERKICASCYFKKHPEFNWIEHVEFGPEPEVIETGQLSFF
jgi:hypothetical protein